ncbi:IS701 family transposase [Streptomyces sp. JNUCC 64]
MLLADVGAHLFAPLRRAEQRVKAEQYVRGLLASPGRKTLRNVAAEIDGGASRQSVHHFISSSPWDWVPVRRALARYVLGTLEPRAWVIRPTAILKVGPHSIGVDHQYVPHLGQKVNAQQVLGAWMVSDDAAVPVDWHLLLPPRWADAQLRRRAQVPDDVVPLTLDSGVREAALSCSGLTGPMNGPVVVDVPGVAAIPLARRLAAAGLTFLIRVDPQTSLRIDRTRLPRYSGAERSASQLAQASVQLRRPVTSPEGEVTTTVAIPVVGGPPPEPGAQRASGLVLLGAWTSGPRDACELWLTNAAVPWPALLRLIRLPGRIEGFAGVAERVGVRDFAGRSFLGWHHHITLSSVAHLIAVLQAAGVERPWVSGRPRHAV